MANPPMGRICAILQDQKFFRRIFGAVAQLGEHHVRNVGVVGSNPICSTMNFYLSFFGVTR